MKLKTIFLTMLLFPLSMMAAEKALIVELNNGQTACFFLQEKPVLTMADAQLNIATATVQTCYPRTDVKRFFFVDGDPEGIETARPDRVLFSQTDADHMEISGLLGKERITLYDTAGHQLSTVSASGDKAVISLSGHKKGVYLIKVGNSQTIKFLKK